MNIILGVFIVLVIIAIPVALGTVIGFLADREVKKDDIQNVYLDKIQNSDENLSLDDLKLTNSIAELKGKIE